MARHEIVTTWLGRVSRQQESVQPIVGTVVASQDNSGRQDWLHSPITLGNRPIPDAVNQTKADIKNTSRKLAAIDPDHALGLGIHSCLVI